MCAVLRLLTHPSFFEFFHVGFCIPAENLVVVLLKAIGGGIYNLQFVGFTSAASVLQSFVTICTRCSCSLYEVRRYSRLLAVYDTTFARASDL